MAHETHTPRHMRIDDAAVDGARATDRRALRAFVVATMALLLAPLVLMPFLSSDANAEKRELAPAPTLVVDGRLNTSFLSDAGEYFSDHFALRSQLVDMDATLKQALLTSSTDNVVVGTDGWLYYAGTLNDYQRKNSMSDHALENIAWNLSLLQESFASQGKNFVLAVAPNKNELYPQHIPYYELHGEGASNMERLLPLLDKRQVRYADLHAAFRATDDVLYFQRDSHWTDQGALLAYEQIMAALGKTPVDYAVGPTAQSGHMGDVDLMLHPVFAQAENQTRPVGVDRFDMVNDATSVEDSYIVTKAVSAGTPDSLIMYRDSFGNNLMLPFAATYSQAVFTKLVPYDMGTKMTAFAQDVVVERTERHLSSFATEAPYVPALERTVVAITEVSQSDSTLHVSQAQPYLQISGSVDEREASADDHIYVEVATGNVTHTYEAFHLSAPQERESDFEGSTQAATSNRARGDWGYCAYVPLDTVSQGGSVDVRLLVGSTQTARAIATASLSL